MQGYTHGYPATFKGTIKSKSQVTLYMPIWTWQELEKCYEVCYSKIFPNPEVVKFRFYHI